MNNIVKICKVENCNRAVNYSNKNSSLCETHRYNWYRYKSYDKPVKKLPPNIVKICKIHGELTIEQTRLHSKETGYLRCAICRNEQARQRLNHRYITTPKKHEKVKVPSFVSDENKSHAYTILHRFRLKSEDYYAMLEEQNHLCRICKQPETQIKRKSNKLKMLSVDHCHTTGKIRGLLCFKCNMGLGAFRDSVDNLKSAIDYLLSCVQ